MGLMRIARERVSCTLILMAVAHRAGSVRAVFHGSLSLKYLFAARARFITSVSPSRKRYCSNSSPAFCGVRASTASASLSVSFSGPRSGTIPLNILWAKASVRFTKLPKMSASSLLFFA